MWIHFCCSNQNVGLQQALISQVSYYGHHYACACELIPGKLKSFWNMGCSLNSLRHWKQQFGVVNIQSLGRQIDEVIDLLSVLGLPGKSLVMV